jgi:selenocysteine-specific elongation factor
MEKDATQTNASIDFDLVLGTAGHIDHGKSALVLALTGTDPDRLKEEKQRGMTIELGFAQLTLPDGHTVGVVDVPGHERFVRHMIAGATGIDIALLVIAANDGVMPQTREHVAVLETLGITNCVVALTKIDMVDKEWASFMEGEVRSFLKNTTYANAPIVPVSAKTGEGIEALRHEIQTVCNSAKRIHTSSIVRFPVDRAFTIKGAGTVVTGTLWSGSICEGDTLEILPQRIPCRIRQIQRHNKKITKAYAGNRVALNLSNIDTNNVHPGYFIASQNAINPSECFDAYITYLDTAKTEKPLKTGARIHVAHGTREVLGRILFCNNKQALSPNESCIAQIRLDQALPVSSKDHFVIRSYSPMHVIGGGMVLLSHPRKRTKLTKAEQTLHDAILANNVQEEIEAASGIMKLPFTKDELALFLDMGLQDVSNALENAAAAKRIARIGTQEKPLFVANSILRKYLNATERALISFHAKNQNSQGLPKEELRRIVCPRASEACFDAIIKEALDAHIVAAHAGVLAHPRALGSSQEALESAAQSLLAALEKACMAPPDVCELAQSTGVEISMARKALAELECEGKVLRVNSELYFDAKTIENCKRALATHLQAGGSGSAAALKDVMGTTRKYAIPLLERFDSMGFTVRCGNERTLGKAKEQKG